MCTLLRVEAVNLCWVIDDTDDLSTRRGGSLMLLQAIEDIKDTFRNDLEPISSGASVGLFAVKDPAKSDQIANEVRAFFATTNTYRHATFMVDVATDASFTDANESVIALNRWRQMQSLSFAAAGFHEPLARAGDPVCKIDEVRPATCSDTVKGKPSTPVSSSCFHRRKEGKKLKQDFYHRQLADLPDIEGVRFTHDFEDLASDETGKFGFLSGKIAVLYADGNRFGGIQRKCKSPKAQEDWDGYVRGQRKALLAALVQRATWSDGWKTRAGEIRLETLLWGGDEIMFAVPAWVGLELAEMFFQLTRNMRFPDDDSGASLTHAVGLVFCHRNAPIGRVQSLAKELADTCKTKISRADNLLAWVVLESFDQTGMDLDAYATRRYLGRLRDPWKDLVITPEQLSGIISRMPAMKDELPRSAMVRALRLLLHWNGTDPAPHLLERSYASVANSVAQRSDLELLWRDLLPVHYAASNLFLPEQPSPSDLAAWIKLLELWDYVLPTPASGVVARREGAAA